MNTREAATPFFTETPSVGNLFRAMWRLVREWIQARMYTRALKKLDFRPLREDEMTDEMRAAADAAMRIPKDELINI